ncbi:EGF-like, alliinase [Corchorus olitorius]|uniref:EGF-like, alliinase n=1 Tax=Corchorus olitorius TaxID=93759 RepID=A0A1R3JV92_9ROSI|nr:EGF-like, alliinase [Corchorus olitorius]
MVKTGFSSMHVQACLVSSVILNLLFVTYIYLGGQWNLSWSSGAAAEAEAVTSAGHGRVYLVDDENTEPGSECNSAGPDYSHFSTNCIADANSWTSGAAAEAEAIAAVSCSGHGRVYLDGLVDDENTEPVCECNSCYSGPDCSRFLTDCILDANSGDPLFLEPFWKQHAASSAVVVAGWHRMSYKYNNNVYISKELERLIRKLHAVVGNAVTDNSYIIFGAGSTQLLTAAAYALSPENSSSPAAIVASVPYYTLYQQQGEYFNLAKFKFEGGAHKWMNKSDSSTYTIEFVTAPNNPDGRLNKPLLEGPNVKTVYDRAYYWPHYTPITAQADEDLMVFTLSKLTGHAGSRFG